MRYLDGSVAFSCLKSGSRVKHLDGSMVFSGLKQWQNEISGLVYGILVSKAVAE